MAVVPAMATEMMATEMVATVMTKAKGYEYRWCVTVSIAVIRINTITSMRVVPMMTMPAHMNRLHLLARSNTSRFYGGPGGR
ncbi:hypothetical protein HMPREF9696_03952 [Afipia clevelandensis ATCC 49720]|uniref:Uncharacterized protein n=1 Tax=Afipia clevelandensis ATCC 49720 TaxID=883079 RepID=K8NUI2_9BRAD|nr:hypothetical protein HMPREF9696_03952 [Afipia clevelandensis ATCC 49720]